MLLLSCWISVLRLIARRKSVLWSIGVMVIRLIWRRRQNFVPACSPNGFVKWLNGHQLTIANFALTTRQSSDIITLWKVNPDLWQERRKTWVSTPKSVEKESLRGKSDEERKKSREFCLLPARPNTAFCVCGPSLFCRRFGCFGFSALWLWCAAG